MGFWWMCRWAQDASVISASSVGRSPGRKIKASARLSISVILSYIFETINSSPVDESDELPNDFKALGMMPNT